MNICSFQRPACLRLVRILEQGDQFGIIRVQRSFLFILLGVLTACAEFPELDARISDEAENAPFPGFMQTDLLRAEGLTDLTGAEAEKQQMAARLAALKRQASLLQRPVLRASDRRALQNAIARRAP